MRGNVQRAHVERKTAFVQRLLFLDTPSRRAKLRAVDDTVALVRTAAALMDLWVAETQAQVLVGLQTYRRTESAGRYEISFVDFDLSSRWLVVDDVADIPWEDLLDECFEYAKNTIEHLEVRRVDGKPLTKRELASLRRKFLEGLSYEGRPPADAFESDGSELRVYLPQLSTSLDE